jgi:para-aminobenzoate synthetase / 4-amino-4-deoxychorismate lyase
MRRYSPAAVALASRRGDASECGVFSGDGTILLHDPARHQWLSFVGPHEILVAKTAQDVLPALERAQQQVESRGWHAAGFVSYEAAPAFDPAIVVKGDPAFPLAWFGLYDPPETGSGPPMPEEPSPHQGPAPGASWAWPFPLSLPQYSAVVDRIREYIRAGETYQVNFTLRLLAPVPDSAPGLFAAMVAAQGPHYSAYIDTGPYCICCASPELFFRLDGSELVCRPMKGTAPRGLWPAQDRARVLQNLQSEKNRAENIMIVDMVRNDLGRVAETGTVFVEKVFQPEKYPTLWQMTSSVRCQTSKSIGEIFRALFPAASITGAPKVRTTQIIAALECSPRRVYTGAIGFIAPGRQAQFNVAIRTVLIDKLARRAEYGVGGGIVWDSIPEQEFEECRTKAAILAQPGPRFELLETMLWRAGEGVVRLEEHLSRLAGSAEYFSIPLNFELVRTRLAEAISHLPPRAHRVRLILARSGNISVEAAELVPLPRPYRVTLAEEPVDAADIFLYHKTTYRKSYERALAGRPGWDDVLLWNDRHELTESTIGNLVVEMQGRLFTPPLECGVLPGIYRGLLLRQNKVQERMLRVQDLAACTRIYLVNSVRGMWEIHWEEPGSNNFLVG